MELLLNVNIKKQILFYVMLVKEIFKTSIVIKLSVFLLAVSIIILAFGEYLKNDSIGASSEAILTGIVSSTIATIFLECGNSYRNSLRREAALLSYITDLRVMTVSMIREKERKLDDFDEVKFIWFNLPGIARAVADVSEKHKEWLTVTEQYHVNNIILTIKEIKMWCKEYLEESLGITNSGYYTYIFHEEILRKLDPVSRQTANNYELDECMCRIVNVLFFNAPYQNYRFEQRLKIANGLYIDNPNKYTCNDNVISKNCWRIMEDLRPLMECVDKERVSLLIG